jgi:hypothetical protein
MAGSEVIAGLNWRAQHDCQILDNAGVRLAKKPCCFGF